MERQRFGWMSIAMLAMVGSCFAQPPDDAPEAAHGGRGGATSEMPPSAGVNDSGGAPAQPNQVCHSPVKASESLPARVNVVSNEALPPEQEVFVSTLVDQFKAECGACHYEGSQGNFHFTKNDFFLKVDQKALDRIKSDDPKVFMPPPNSGGVPWSSRQNDSVTELAASLEKWIAAGRPADVYVVKNDVGDKPYLFTGELGTGLTNLGSCIPDTNFAFGSAQQEMDELDALFESAHTVPAALDHVVPPEQQLGLPRLLQDTDLNTFDSEVLARNGVVAFVPAYPLWTDGAGKLRHVRVPRGKSIHFNKETQEFEIPPNTRFYKTFFKDVIDRDGNARFRKMETRLIVARPDKIEDGKRVPQALFGTYQWDEDETRAELITQSQRNGEPFKDVLVTYTPDEPHAQAIRDTMPDNLTYELEYDGALRRYAIPGKERCIQCHMGSHNGDFVLGFTPLQIRRRKTDEGGTYEPTDEDELSQLQRLIAYGVLTGIDSEDDVDKLEDSQGDRKPRNDYELKAQGYMLGNCAHCHNPNGFPSQAAPELKDVLQFWPDAEGGIFQFDLETFSPRIRRGRESTPIAYITPSLREMWPFRWQGYTEWTPKFELAGTQIRYFEAPWRSLIYRNVQTTFTYSDDLTLYPHMPMNTAGFDCRAQRILGDWMVSIPAVRKHPNLNENYFPANGLDPTFTDTTTGSIYVELPYTDMEPQPYVEVSPKDAGYAAAQAAAEKRLKAFHDSQQYKNCIMSKDIVDPEILRGGGRTAPLDTSTPPDGVPDLPHWVTTDLTERAGPWGPRRADWQAKLTTDEPKEGDRVVPLLRKETTTLSAGGFETFAKTPLAMALWKKQDGCHLESQPKAGDFTGSKRPRWLDISQVPGDEPIFTSLPGQAVFDMICVNCHGRAADSRGRQADTVQTLSGGETRVANLRDGLFGPPGNQGANLDSVFSVVANATVTERDWAARYMAWMALGGTERVIPAVVLGQVARTDVSGTTREFPLLSDLDANMLASARQACRLALPFITNPARVGVAANKFAIAEATTALIEENGDAELWQQLCSYNNPSVVRVIQVPEQGFVTFSHTLYRGSAYPAGASVGDQHGNAVAGLDPTTNRFPWCVDGATNPKQVGEYLAQFDPKPPLCPAGFLTLDNQMTPEDAEDWATRGAINAGFSVFVFLEALTKGQLTVNGTSQPFHPVRYDECQLLAPQ
jgi:mono/diheme cytochrome c family protein